MTSSTTRSAADPARHDAEPLLIGGLLAQVDRHPICAGCGLQVTPVTGFAWRHGARPRTPNRWFTPVTPRRLAATTNYSQFAERFPWAVASYPGGPAVTTEDEWAEARRRLADYARRFARARRRPEPLIGDYSALVRTLAGKDGSGCGTGAVRWPLSPGLAQILRPDARRRELASALAWAVPTEPAVQELVTHGPLLETGAGTGYWTALVRQFGGDVLAYDLYPVGTGENTFHHAARAWSVVGAASAMSAVGRHRDRTLFLCWPPFGDDASSYHPLRRYRGHTLLYAGDGPLGVSGSARFHRELSRNWTLSARLELPGWPGIDDRLSVYRRAGQHRAGAGPDRCPSCRRFVTAGWIGRCLRCMQRHPTPLAVAQGEHLREYSAAELALMPTALVQALEHSRGRVRF